MDQPWPGQGAPGHPIVYIKEDPCIEVDVGISCMYKVLYEAVCTWNHAISTSGHLRSTNRIGTVI